MMWKYIRWWFQWHRFGTVNATVKIFSMMIPVASSPEPIRRYLPWPLNKAQLNNIESEHTGWKSNRKHIHTKKTKGVRAGAISLTSSWRKKIENASLIRIGRWGQQQPMCPCEKFSWDLLDGVAFLQSAIGDVTWKNHPQQILSRKDMNHPWGLFLCFVGSFDPTRFHLTRLPATLEFQRWWLK